jgi:hypothetical protein
VGAPLQTITVRRVSYLVEPVKDPHAHLIPVHFVLHDPRGRCFLVVPSKQRPDRLIALSRFTHFAPYRPTPFGGMWFTVENGKLVIAPADA